MMSEKEIERIEKLRPYVTGRLVDLVAKLRQELREDNYENVEIDAVLVNEFVFAVAFLTARQIKGANSTLETGEAIIERLNQMTLERFKRLFEDEGV